MGTDLSGTAKRVGYGASSVIHVSLGIAAAQMAMGSSGSGGSKQTYVAQLLQAPFGASMLGAVGVAVIITGVVQLVKAVKTKFEDKLKTGEMSYTERVWAIRIGRFGLAARGVVFPIIGMFLIQAAINHGPSRVKGVGGALREIASQSYGPWLLALIAAGLTAYGAHMLVNARFRRIPDHR